MPVDENGNEIVETPQSGLDESRIAELIQSQVEKSFKNVLDSAQENQRSQEEEYRQAQRSQTQQTQSDPIAEWLNPHIQPHLQRANLASAAAMDKADFYSSEEWENLDSIIDDGESDLRQEKKTIREAVEKRFNELVRNGVPTPRKTVLSLVLGEKLTSKPEEFLSKAAKRGNKNKEAELNKARSASDIGSVQAASMSREDIYSMSEEDFEKTFADIQF